MATTTALPKDVRAKYEPVIGLEIHVQLLTATKIFLRLPDRFGAPPTPISVRSAWVCRARCRY